MLVDYHPSVGRTVHGRIEVIVTVPGESLRQAFGTERPTGGARVTGVCVALRRLLRDVGAAAYVSRVLMERVTSERLDEELAKAEEVRDPPVPVWAWLMLDSQEVAAELHGWSSNPNGSDDGLRGLVTAVREYSPGFRAEFCGWVRASHIRQRAA